MQDRQFGLPDARSAPLVTVSITVVGWGAYPPTLNNVAVRLGSGAWVPMVVGSNNPQLAYVLADEHARASVVWRAFHSRAL